jgi:hypothetical protein
LHGKAILSGNFLRLFRYRPAAGITAAPQTPLALSIDLPIHRFLHHLRMQGKDSLSFFCLPTNPTGSGSM